MPARILIVEDHGDLAEALEVNLRRAGYEAEMARDARQALFAMRAHEPDLVMLDLGLPGMDGFSLLGRLRADGWEGPVLILSARGAPDDKVEGFRLGADDYVTKPFHTMELMARVGALLRRAGAAARSRDEEDDADDDDAAAEAAGAPPSPIGFSDEELVRRFGLSLRQAAVTRLIAAGLTNPEIADELGISRFTARNHTAQILAKLGVPSRGRVGAMLRVVYDRERAAV